MPKKFLEIAVLIGVVLYVVASYFVIVLIASLVMGVALCATSAYNWRTGGRLFTRTSTAGRRLESRLTWLGLGCLGFGVFLVLSRQKNVASIGVALIVLVIIISIFATVLQSPNKSSAK